MMKQRTWQMKQPDSTNHQKICKKLISLLREMVDRHAKELTELNKRLGSLAKWFRYIWRPLASGFSWETANRKPHNVTWPRPCGLAVTFAVCSSRLNRRKGFQRKRFTARFFRTKNCTVSRLKAWTSFLYPFAMCLLDFDLESMNYCWFLGD